MANFNVGQSYTGDQLRGWGFNPDNTNGSQTVGGQTYSLTNDNGMRRVNAGGSPGTPGGGSYGAAMGAVGDALGQLPGQQRQSFNDFWKGIKDEQNTFYNNFNTANGNAISAASTKYNLPGQLDTVNALNSRIADLSGNLSGTGGGGYTASDQVDKAINTNYLPRAQQATSNLNTSAGLADQEVGLSMTPWQKQADAITSRIASESTGFNDMQRNELDGLLEKYRTLGTLTAAEMTKATDLAKMENEWHIAKLSSDTQIQNNRYVHLDGGLIFDRQTGTYITPTRSNQNTNGRPSLDSFNR